MIAFQNPKQRKYHLAEGTIMLWDSGISFCGVDKHEYAISWTRAAIGNDEICKTCLEKEIKNGSKKL